MRKEGESTTMGINHHNFRLAFDNASYEGKDIGVSRMSCKKKTGRIVHKQLVLKHNGVVSD